MWQNLPIVIRRRVRQSSGHRMQSSRASDRGFHIRGVRELEVGDAPRAVSRKHYVRTGEEIVIEKYAERNALILVLMDVSASMLVGAGRRKHEASLELLRRFCEACLWKGNTLRVLAFTTVVELESRPITDTSALEAVFEKLASLKPSHSGTDYRDVIALASVISGRREQPADLVCIVSDFLFPQPRLQLFRALDALQEVADVIAFVMRDRIEVEMPPVSGALMVRDAETGETFWAGETSGYDPAKELERFDIDACVVTTAQTEEEWFEALADFFTERRLKR